MFKRQGKRQQKMKALNKSMMEAAKVGDGKAFRAASAKIDKIRARHAKVMRSRFQVEAIDIAIVAAIGGAAALFIVMMLAS